MQVDLRPDEDRAREIVQRLGRQMFPSSRERRRRVPQPILHWRIAFPHSRSRSGFQRDRPDAQRPNDEGFEIGSSDPLTSGTVRRRAGDEAAGDVVAMPRSLLDHVGRRWVRNRRRRRCRPAGLVRGLCRLFTAAIRFSLKMALHSSPQSSSTIAACSPGTLCHCGRSRLGRFGSSTRGKGRRTKAVGRHQGSPSAAVRRLLTTAAARSSRKARTVSSSGSRRRYSARSPLPLRSTTSLRSLTS